MLSITTFPREVCKPCASLPLVFFLIVGTIHREEMGNEWSRALPYTHRRCFCLRSVGRANFGKFPSSSLASPHAASSCEDFQGSGKWAVEEWESPVAYAEFHLCSLGSKPWTNPMKEWYVSYGKCTAYPHFGLQIDIFHFWHEVFFRMKDA